MSTWRCRASFEVVVDHHDLSFPTNTHTSLPPFILHMASCKAATFIAFRSVVKRSLTTLPSTRSCPTRHLQAPQLHSTTAACARKLPRNHFSSNRILRQEEHAAISSEHKQRKATSKRAANHSLRKVAVAAQSQRNGLIRGSGKTRYVDPHADTKEVTAYCAAEKYNLSRARWELDREGYKADPFGTNLFPQVLHVQTPNYITPDEATGGEKPQGPGDVFVFPSGCIVTWNVPDKLANNIIQRFLPAAAGKQNCALCFFPILKYVTYRIQ